VRSDLRRVSFVAVAFWVVGLETIGTGAVAQRRRSQPSTDVEIGVACGQIQWQPRGDAFGCREINGPNAGLAIYGSDGRRRALISNFPVFGSEFAWSPDGTEIAGFETVGRPPAVTLVVMSADGANRRVISPPMEGAGSLSWRPNGHEIAYSVRNDVFIVSIDSSEVRNLGHGTRPSWSPNGEHLAYAREISGNSSAEVCIVEQASGQTRCAGGFENASRIASGPQWSSDGTHLAVAGGARQGGGGFLAVASMNNGVLGEFVRVPGVSGVPFTWSLDGTELVVPAPDTRHRQTNAPFQRHRIVAVRRSDLHVRTVVEPDRGVCGAWQPNWSSRGLAYRHTCAPPHFRDTLRIRTFR
jgi:dipeptidyl aminopeptidase/acylaminoacyl peptidase